jgi:hypothetical protein
MKGATAGMVRCDRRGQRRAGMLLFALFPT